MRVCMREKRYTTGGKGRGRGARVRKGLGIRARRQKRLKYRLRTRRRVRVHVYGVKRRLHGRRKEAIEGRKSGSKGVYCMCLKGEGEQSGQGERRRDIKSVRRKRVGKEYVYGERRG